MKSARRFLPALLCTLVGALAISAPALAEDTQVFYKEFNGQDSTGGPFNTWALGPVGVDREAEVLYVRNRSLLGVQGKGAYPGTIDRFDFEGNAKKYPGLDTSSLPADVGYFNYLGENPERMAIDNTGGATQGNIYLGAQSLGVHGFTFDGLKINNNFPFPRAQLCGVEVGPAGELWVTGASRTWKFTSAGVYAGVERVVQGCQADFDTNGVLYAAHNSGPKKYAALDFAALGDVGINAAGQTWDLAVDPTTNDVWVNYKTHIAGFHRTDPLVASLPFEVLTGFEQSAGHAFDADGNLFVSEMGREGDQKSTKVYIFKKQPKSAPVIKRQIAQDVRSVSAILRSHLATAGYDTTRYYEYGLDSNYGNVTPSIELPHKTTPYTETVPIFGLAPATTYHYRVVATNQEGTTYGPDRVFKTFPTPPGGNDPCPNALARKQTGARALPDCRAYELVSAPNTGGADVESTLVPGQEPYAGTPAAEDRALYALHAGLVPGTDNPTNRGSDPYVATRGADGWETRYVGIPANINELTDRFSSTLAEASARLDSFAFAGDELCAPCFPTGIETGIPVRLPDGTLVQGMAGSLNPGPSAKPEGYVGKRFSADGRYLVFGSSSKFEPDGNSGGDITIYVRDLVAGTTRVASKTPGGQTMTGAGIAQLDISDDGSRVTIARGVEDGLWTELRMTIGDSDSSVALAPGASDPVQFSGQTANGSTVFFTSEEDLVGADTDSSADIYAADVDSQGGVDLRLVSAGGGNSCEPVDNADHTHWNSTGGTATCNAVAIAGGGGVARGSGAIYFLSPEQLDGSAGSADQPNLYVAAPNGSIRFVATLEPNHPAVRNAIGSPGERRPADFQTNSSGGHALFTSALPLTGAESGNLEAFLFAASGDELICVSCEPTGGESLNAVGDAFLSPSGMSLTDDGRAFFTTPGALVLNDSNQRRDVYQWSDGYPRLISSGIGQFDSALHSVSADGTDAFFFTHDRLAPTEDENGTLTRLYTARANGGFFVIPPPPPCKASDECHGPGTVAPPPPPINSAVPTRAGNVKPLPKCKANQVRRNGKCVKKNAGKKAKRNKAQRNKAKRNKRQQAKRQQAKRHHKGNRNHG